jgi:general secretion pathway protein K
MKKKGFTPKYQGTALLSALVVVSILTVLLTKLLSQQAYLIRQVEATHGTYQSNLLLDGGIDWAKVILRGDPSHIDHQDENWAVPIRRVPVESGNASGHLSGQMIDAQSRFNVNNLLPAFVPNLPASKAIPINIQQLNIFKRLLITYKLPPEWADKVAKRLQESRPPAREKVDYTEEEITSVLLPLSHIDELFDLLQANPEQQERLKQCCIVLPKLIAQSTTTTNINTVDEKLLSAILNQPQVAKDIIESRQRAWFNSTSDVMTRLQSYRYNMQDLDQQTLSVNSQFFVLQGELEGQNAQGERMRYVSIEALLYRDTNKRQTATIWKRFSGE